jgi:hypothetical protein
MEGLSMYRYVTAVVLLLAVLAAPLEAFDTGHHYDMTSAALMRRGFSGQAIQTVQVANWLTDYFSADLPIPGFLAKTPAEVQQAVEDLHFDCLFDKYQIDRYWNNLAFNTKEAVQDTVSAFQGAGNDQVKKQAAIRDFLILLGISLHAVQDFYTHSNWVETHKRTGANYKTATWWTTAVGPDGKLTASTQKYYTGWYEGHRYKTMPPAADAKHGTYVEGLNHDSYSRQGPNVKWDEAYVFAYAGTVEWVNAVLQWARAKEEAKGVPGGAFEQALNRYDLGDPLSSAPARALAADLVAARQISEWVRKPDFLPGSPQNGHWKGFGSGWLDNLRIVLTVDGHWGQNPNSTYVDAFRAAQPRLQNKLNRQLYSTSLRPNFGKFPVPNPLSGTAVSIRTIEVVAPKSANVYARIRVGDPDGNEQIYDEAMQNGESKTTLNPAWWTIHFVDSSVGLVPITYELRRQNDIDPKHDTVFNLKGTDDNDKALRFVYDLETGNLVGDVNGRHNTQATSVEKRGGANQSVRVKFFVNSTPVGP